MENFRSYGEASVEFSPNQNYFFGRNWQGKSSIMDAIGFALFGRDVFPRKIAGSAVLADNFVREGAEKGLVKLSFEHGGKEYDLVRNLPGSKVELSREDKKWTSIKTVKEAMQEIFGLDSNLFANVFYSEQDDLRKILESDPKDRKVFVEMLLGFEYVEKVKMSAKHASDKLTEFIDEVTSGNVKTVMQMIGEIKKQVSDKTKLVDGLEKQIREESNQGRSLTDISKAMGDSQRKAESLLQTKSRVESEADNDREIAKSISTGKCPTCRQTIPKDVQLKVIHDLNDKIRELEERIRVLKTDYSKANAEWGKASREHDDGLTREERLSNLDGMKGQYASDLEQLRTSLGKYEVQYKAFANKAKVIDRVNKEKQFLEDFQVAIEAFRDNLRKTVKVDLENGVNHFMAQFSDADFDAKLRINDEFGFEVVLHGSSAPIFNMSGAAKDILALGLRYGLYRIAARDVNFILFDEPTRHMDQSNTLKLKEAFNEMKNEQIIVITVHDEFYDAQGVKFMIEKDSDFLSTLHKMN